jgi:hypothetical protein
MIIKIRERIYCQNMCTYLDAFLAAEVCAQTLDRHVYLQVKKRQIKTP